MATVSELLSQHYQVRREVSQTSDLANLLLGRLKYDLATRQSSAIKDLERRLEIGPLNNVAGNRSTDFIRWLNGQYLIINKTIRGVTYYPIHPALALSINGEGPRVEGFISLVVESFTPEERLELVEKLWTVDALPVFEQLIYNLIDWQLPQTPLAAPASAERFAGHPVSEKTISPSVVDLLIKVKEDLLALSSVTTGVQAFVVHAGRLLALTLSRFFLLQSGIALDVPIYAAPAADSHEGVRALAHETLELHRARYAQALEERFRAFTIQAMQENGCNDDPQIESSARALVGRIFHYNANIIPRSQDDYQKALSAMGSFTDLAYHYYWSHSGAPSRFLRQLHTAQLNMAKKAGLASSRSRYSQWSFYWLSPSLVETLLLVSQARLKKDRMLVSSLLADWRKRYDIAVLIDESWEDIYRRNFRSFGSPETLNEVNQRRFLEILAERGRLRKNSDDFPWVVLKD